MNSIITKRIFIAVLVLSMFFTFTACKKEKTSAVTAPISSVPVSYDAQIAEGVDLDTIINNCFNDRKRVIGTLIGILIIALLRVGISAMKFSPDWQYIITGIIVALAVYTDIRSSARKK